VGGTEMELAKIAKGQVTIPINVRKKLILKEGDKLILKKMATWRLRTLP
jgi:AbrB family looped-hinge helix DNA binding protein